MKKSTGKKKSGNEKKKAWTPEEKKALCEGIDKYGIGKWKKIKQFYPDILKDRTPVDIKDKHRNMTTRKCAPGKERNRIADTRKGPVPRRGDGRDRSLPLPVLADKGNRELLKWGGLRVRSVRKVVRVRSIPKDRSTRTAGRTDNGRSIPGMSSLTRLPISELPSSSEGTNPDLRRRSLRQHATLSAKINAARVSAARKAAAAAGSSSMDGNEASVPPGAAPTAIVSSIRPHAAVNATIDGSERNGESVPPSAVSTAIVSSIGPRAAVDARTDENEHLGDIPTAIVSSIGPHAAVDARTDENEHLGDIPTAIVSSIGPDAAVNARTDENDQNTENGPLGDIPTTIVSTIGPHAAVSARTDARTAGSGSMDGPEQNGEDVPASANITSSSLDDLVGVHIEDDQNEVIERVMDLLDDQQKAYREKAVRELDEFLTKQRLNMRKSIIEVLSARRSE